MHISLYIWIYFTTYHYYKALKQSVVRVEQRDSAAGERTRWWSVWANEPKWYQFLHGVTLHANAHAPLNRVHIQFIHLYTTCTWITYRIYTLKRPTLSETLLVWKWSLIEIKDTGFTHSPNSMTLPANWWIFFFLSIVFNIETSPPKVSFLFSILPRSFACCVFKWTAYLTTRSSQPGACKSGKHAERKYKRKRREKKRERKR